MTDKHKILALHAACVVLVIICFVLSRTLLKNDAELGQVLVGAGMLIWGKLGFEPASPVAQKLVMNAINALTDDEIQRMSQRPAKMSQENADSGGSATADSEHG